MSLTGAFNFDGSFKSTVANGNELNNIITGNDGNQILSGLAGNDVLDGEDEDDILLGGSGDDVLIGGRGTDRLLGSEGDDRFDFSFFLSPFITDVDTIADFVAADDAIQISAFRFGGGLTAGGAISAGQFRLGTGALDTSDRFIYNSKGELFFDSDGVGAAAQVQFATLIGVPMSTAADVVVI